MGFCKNFMCCGICFTICAVLILIGAVSYKHISPTPDECLECPGARGEAKERPYGYIGNIAILTNLLSDTGIPTAKTLYQHNTTVIIGSPNITKANNIRTQILRDTNLTNQANLIPIQLNLSNFTSINNFIHEFKSKYSSLNILINNDNNTENNHLSHFYLTQKLTPILKQTNGISRVIHMGKYIEKININISKELLNDINKYGSAANIIYNKEYNKRYGKGKNGIYSVHLHSGMLPVTHRLHVDAAKKALTLIHFASMNDYEFVKYGNKGGENVLGELLWNVSKKSIEEKGFMLDEKK
eukprot:733866_1